MKISTITKLVVVASLGFASYSCESHEMKADDAFEDVKDEKSLENDSANKLRGHETDAGNPAIVKTVYILDDWAKLKNEFDKKIGENERLIKKMKGTPNTSAKILKRITVLEKDNNYCRTKMAEYEVKAKADLEKFKSELEKEVVDLHVELDAMTLGNN